MPDTAIPERRAKVRTISTITVLMDITFTQIRKTEKDNNVQADAGESDSGHKQVEVPSSSVD